MDLWMFFSIIDWNGLNIGILSEYGIAVLIFKSKIWKSCTT